MNRTLGFSILGAGALLVIIGITSNKDGDTNSDYRDNNSAGDNLSFTPMEFVTMADTLFNAKGILDDDEEAFYSVFESLRTSSDLSQLINVFGERKQYIFGDAMNLSAWVKDTLNASEQQRVKTVYDKFNVPY